MSKIDDLQQLFDKELAFEDCSITILPNGEIRKVGDFEDRELKPGQKPLTFREYLGGEYGQADFVP